MSMTHRNHHSKQCQNIWNHFRVIFMVKIIKRITEKLRRIILLHFGLLVIAFRFHYGRDREVIIFMISGFSDVSMTPQTNIIYLWRHQDTPNSSRKNTESFFEQYYYAYNSRHFENRKHQKRRAPTNHENRSYMFLKMLNMSSRSFKKHEHTSWKS